MTGRGVVQSIVRVQRSEDHARESSTRHDCENVIVNVLGDLYVDTRRLPAVLE